MKFKIISTLLFFSIALISCSGEQQTMEEQAQKIHEEVITMDTHDDINTQNFTAETNYTQDLETQVNIPKMKAGGLDVAWLVVYTGQGDLTEEGYADAYENAIDKFDAIHRLTEEIAPDEIELALSSEDVRRIIGSGKKAAMIGVENAYPLAEDIARVKEFYDRGARYMSLAHNGHSQLSDSNTGERDDEWLHNGLSDFGKEVIKEMNKWGIAIDLSHPSKEANLQAIELSQAPVMASHSSARTVNDVSRNLSDEELLKIKENGGVVHAVAFKSYVDSEKNSQYSDAVNEIMQRMASEAGFEIKSWGDLREMDEDAREEYITQYRELQDKAAPVIEEEVEAPPVNVADFVDHIDYMVDLIGIDHVGISSDFDGGGGVEGWNDASETFNVTLELVKRGYSAEEIEKLWSGNLMRVLDEVAAVAEKIQQES
ncbi:dipeptidase [Rhodohalobacter sp. 614A]|uniref:dipeptidase n=1 Tax=Rhodohalobacter sp. 614A TaxID=2908649 RepID=UPI001F476C0B|nr:dipeptidase [Rhodohalobacter sp. 614A]